MLKTLRALLVFASAWPAAAQSGLTNPEQAARELIAQAAQALAGRHAAGFLEAFDRPLADQLRKPVGALVQDYSIQPALEFLDGAASGGGITVTLKWNMDLTAREGQRSVTHRHWLVDCSVAPRDGALRITRFSGNHEPLSSTQGPAALFAPPRVDGAWDLLQAAARALSQPDTPAAGFLALFDARMPEYEKLRAGADGLAAEGQLNSSIGLTSDEGSDTARTLEVDWTLEVVHSETGMRIAQRERQLTFQMERRGKRWLITSLAPADFFQP